MATRPPVPPFTRETAAQKVQAAEDGWNTCDAARVSLAYSEDSVWRNRDSFIQGRPEIVAFLTAKWERELDYSLRKALWAFEENRIAVRYQYESHDAAGDWYRSYGNELWEFDAQRPDDAPRGQHQRRAHLRERAATLRPAPRGGAWAGVAAAVVTGPRPGPTLRALSAADRDGSAPLAPRPRRARRRAPP